MIPLDIRDAHWTEKVVRAMGSTAHLVVGDAPDGVVDWACAELERLEQCWSRFRPDSELARLNANTGTWTRVSTPMLLALSCAADLHAATRGRFDPTILDALERAGYDRTFASLEIDAPGPPPAATAAPGFASIELDAEGSRARLPAGTRVDLGGIGKGLAADLVARGLVERGARSVIVGLGGDLRARGEPPPQGPWDVPVMDPFDDERVAFRFPLAHGALVTSTTRIRTWTRGGRRYHHLIDPASGDSARSGLAAAVVHGRDAWWSEGIAKAAVVAGAEAGAALVHDAGVRAWLFGDDGSVYECGARA
jgi:thiamine biosynthesis lipoprotein